ncbi:MAG: DUF6290 family protein [Bacteroidales bacterium]|nr:DUF6290 family protein [Clostridium sp.]MCM1205001.1 DUF6290 family protein [Bacteroidales bacterium]
MSRIGRPRSDAPSKHRVSVRLTEAEFETLKQYADAHNQTISQAMKSGIALLIEKQSR